MRRFLQSSVGMKAVVAVTGLVLFGFLIGHVAGNLQIFLGPQKLNDYAAFLKNAKGLVWTTRVVLLASVFLHIYFTVKLTRHNRASRPVPYAVYTPVQASFSSRFMIWTGLLLLLYIPYHIFHFTIGVPHPRFDPHDIYANMVIGFSVWYVSAFYIAAMIALGFHLFHGVWSVFQTLGLTHPKYHRARRGLAVGAALLISGGFISIPVGVLTGVIR